MKKITFFTIALMFLLAGCTKDLVSVDYGEINPAIFPKTAADIESMVNAAYYPLRGSWFDGIFSTSERGVMMISDCTTEILTGWYDEKLEATQHSYTPDVAGITYFYDSFYNKISRMTLTIDLIQESSVSEELKKKAIAEIRCARGLLAYTLFDLYGPIVIAPLEVLKNPLQEQPLARMPYDDMVNFIEADLLAAAEDLPYPAEADYGRFNKALAKMLLIRLNLHEKRWDKVVQLANDIIGYNYYHLDDDYVGMWGLDGAKKSPEVIWAIPCDYEGTSQNQWQLMVLPGVYAPKGGWGTIQSSWWFYDTFESLDKRKTMLITQFTDVNGVTYNRANPGSYLNYGPLPLKINEDAARTTSYSTVDIIMYRYADVLLSKAEALANGSGTPSQESIDLINQVRHRAGIGDVKLADYSSLNAFNDMLLTERSHEFWCENGQYRADLIRHDKFVSRCLEVRHSSYTAKYKEVFPFSRGKISEGKGKFIQNPFYN
ncbi:RagB/SusD family nutrient uptake outer membrane protein (plasmid) [Pedobacter sp. BS3]|uniref:RagB/SusD family nutrient uptake outer membrane protein n=1 Tax=Pedobacter sp. BS3 TaxID=2567937 RepID=UPI0011EFDD5F|nr:RagB/SusD family nutrient uptake outer membrane protein [Pedobacter sp. BS3]TZF85694.1 RagB/SusD family nutrient uptake outer membrane protein [Pedobacter sp. BS3]